MCVFCLPTNVVTLVLCVSPSPCNHPRHPPKQRPTPLHCHLYGSRLRCGMMAAFLWWWELSEKSVLGLVSWNGNISPLDLCSGSEDTDLNISTYWPWFWDATKQLYSVCSHMYGCKSPLTRYVMSLFWFSCLFRFRMILRLSPSFSTGVSTPAKMTCCN